MRWRRWFDASAQIDRCHRGGEVVCSRGDAALGCGTAPLCVHIAHRQHAAAAAATFPYSQASATVAISMAKNACLLFPCCHDHHEDIYPLAASRCQPTVHADVLDAAVVSGRHAAAALDVESQQQHTSTNTHSQWQRLLATSNISNRHHCIEHRACTPQSMSSTMVRWRRRRQQQSCIAISLSFRQRACRLVVLVHRVYCNHPSSQCA